MRRRGFLAGVASGALSAGLAGCRPQTHSAPVGESAKHRPDSPSTSSHQPGVTSVPPAAALVALDLARVRCCRRRDHPGLRPLPSASPLPDAGPQEMRRYGQGSRGTAEAADRLFAHVTSDDGEHSGMRQDPRRDANPTWKNAGIAYTGSNPVPAT